jgi:hypothetical protein
MKFYKILFFLLLTGLFACTDLEEELNEDLTTSEANDYLNANADIDNLLLSVYEGLKGPIFANGQIEAMNSISTDEAIAPTRGGDWDDGGKWRQFHLHTFDGANVEISNAWNNMLTVVFNATNVLNFDGVASPQQLAEAKFLRAFAMFIVADNWNQVPFREPGDNLLLPSTVLTGPDALDFIISECESILNDLPDGPPTKANKDAARTLLMKAYLNKGTFADRSAPKFETGDMQKVIDLANQLSGTYSLADNYFDNFAPNNDAISTENIFTGASGPSDNGGDIRWFWNSGLHYNQTPSGWNGFATLSDFYDSFEDGDQRKYTEYPGSFENGVASGFLFGQQYDALPGGNPLNDRNGNPLSFTRDVAIQESGNDLEVTGIRVMKYPIDYSSIDDPNNDGVYFRYADVLLMKAEALLRTNMAGEALTIVNDIREKRGATPLSSLDENALLAERGRELYWENWRRNDLIRFGKFLDAWQEKPASDASKLLFPIPPGQLAVNPNLEQNAGY